MILMLAVDKNFSIGYDGDLLFHIKKDLARFQKFTSGHILVMGRKTLESFPGKKPLPDRTNLVITNDKNYTNHDAVVLNDINNLDEKLQEINPDGDKLVFLVGGGNLVKQLLDKCHLAYMTKVDYECEEFDTSIPNLDQLENWKLVEESPEMSGKQKGEEIKYKYLTYINCKC